MPVSKVEYFGKVLLDLTADTVRPENVDEGVTFHDAAGQAQTGTRAAGEGGSGGGGLPDGVAAIASGTITPTSDRSTALDVEHGLGVIPDFCWWVLEQDVSSSNLTNATVVGCFNNKPAKFSSQLATTYHSHYFIVAYNSSGALQRTAQSAEAAAFTTTTCRIMANAQYRLKAGCTYRWVCGVLS